MRLITAEIPESPARATDPVRPPLTVGLVQTRWHADPDEHLGVLADGIRTAAEAGAQVIFLPELSLSRYPADTRPDADATATAEDLGSGPTYTFAAKAAADTGVAVHASLFERADTPDGHDAPDGLGYNTAILVAPDGSLIGRTRKLHIPVSAGYYEDHYFRGGPAGPTRTPWSISPMPGVDRRSPGSGCRPAGTSGSPRSPARTPSPGRR
jgi:N-carbamoylputrescine amidase